MRNLFTGIVEDIGKVVGIRKGSKSATIQINSEKILEDINLGDSVSTNGVCLTVTKFDSKCFWVDVMPETMRRTNLGILASGSKVNLERALRLGDRFGGHIVTGHIDGTGEIKNIKKEDNAFWISIQCDSSVMKYIIKKGSIAIDGVSLTVAQVSKDNIFKVSIIPHTKEKTILLNKNVGDTVNLEGDMVGKYIENFMKFNENEAKNKSSLDIDFLKDNGFY